MPSSSISTTLGGNWLTVINAPVSKANEILGASYQLYQHVKTNAMCDLFVQHEQLSIDQVQRLKIQVNVNVLKLESIKAVAKEGWEEEVDKVAVSIKQDKATISAW